MRSFQYLLLLALLLASCRLQEGGGPTGVNTDASGIGGLSLTLKSSGSVEWSLTSEPGLVVYHLGAGYQMMKKDNDGPTVTVEGSYPTLGDGGTFEVYLRRARDGRWVKAGLPYTVSIRPDGTVSLGTSRVQVEAVPNEDALPFYLGQAHPPVGNPYTVPWPKNPDPNPLAMPTPFCLGKGAGWPFGRGPTNTSPDFPPVAPSSPPALMTPWGSALPGHALIHYTQERYVRALDATSSYGFPYGTREAYAPPPGETMEVRTVIYLAFYDPGHPLHGRWARVYWQKPQRLWWEGDELRWEISPWVAELMPEGFTIPGYNPDTGVFEMHRGVPMTLPPEMNPYLGR